MVGFLRNIFKPNAPIQGSEVADIYRSLRHQVLSISPTDIGLSTDSPNRVWAVLVETGYRFPRSVVSLVTIADGTVSLYFSTGGGIIGIGQHQEPREACFDLLTLAPQFLPHAQPTTIFPLPNIGHTQFYFLTYDGAFMYDAQEKDLTFNRSPLSPLFHKAQAVITQARIAEGKAKESAQRLLYAARTGDTEGLRALLDAGTSVNSADKTGLTPLMASSFTGKADVVRLLLDSGATIDAMDSCGYTALIFACNAGQQDCAHLLIERGADINHRDNDASTPIMFAAQHGYNKVVRLLLDHGADPEFKGKHGLSAIGFAKQNRHTETESILVNHTKG